jgi:hypothetical protein
MYRLYDCNGQTYDMSCYLGKQHVNAAAEVTPTHGTTIQLTIKIEGVGHKP